MPAHENKPYIYWYNRVILYAIILIYAHNVYDSNHFDFL